VWFVVVVAVVVLLYILHVEKGVGALGLKVISELHELAAQR